MKYLLLLILIVPIYAHAQDPLYSDLGGRKVKGILLPVNKDGNAEYNGVVEVPGVSGQKMYKRMQEFMAYIFRSRRDVTQLDDEETHKIMVKGLFDVTPRPGMAPTIHPFVRFVMQLQSKDGKYRYRIGDFKYLMEVGGTAYPIRNENIRRLSVRKNTKLREEINGNVTDMITVLGKYIHGHAGFTNDDW